jgi:hypothetical protein
MPADGGRRLERTGGVADYTRPPQARRSAELTPKRRHALSEGIVEGARCDE